MATGGDEVMSVGTLTDSFRTWVARLRVVALMIIITEICGLIVPEGAWPRANRLKYSTENHWEGSIS